jgi:malate/lactate dehydrogenase
LKVGILGGAGGIGSSIGFYLATRGLVEEIVLIDVKQNVATSHAMDIQQAASELNSTIIRAGDWEALSGCGIVIMAAGSIQHNSLENNLKIVSEVAPRIARYCPDAAVITVTNPIDPFNYILHKISGMPAQRFVGYSRNDTARLRTAIAKRLEVQVSDVAAMVIGEHGQAMVPLFSSVTLKGKRVELSSGQRYDILNYLKTWFASYEGLNAGRTAAWTSAVGIAHLVEAMVKNTGEILACSAVLEGQYGISEVSVGVPVVLGLTGIERIIELPLSEEETTGLRAAAEKMSGTLKKLSWQAMVRS